MAENQTEGIISANDDEYSSRLLKLNALNENGKNPYAAKFKRSHTILKARGLGEGKKVSLCGRLTAKRVMGKIIFADIFDIDAKIQICISQSEAPDAFELFKEYTDVADFIGVSGRLFITRAGELTVRVGALSFLSKALRPLPEKWHGVSDTDLRYRQRYLDLISNEDTREVFKTRLKTIAAIRKYLVKNGFIEVETPILQNAASGANARPFCTKHNALNKDYFLRIAPELYLKQVVAGGFDRVFELGKNFRNEGMDASHLQEFTMLEWYAAYWDYRDNIEFLKGLIKEVFTEVNGGLTVRYQGGEFDFSDFKELDYSGELSKIIGTDILKATSADELKEFLYADPSYSKEELSGLHSVTAAVDFVFKKKLRPYIKAPTITFNYPAYMVPLARRNDKNPALIDMFQLIVNGWEMCKAYSELVNPLTQRETFSEQSQNKAAGDDEAMAADEGFLLAMEHGMPPMSGLGLGIDRLINFLTDQPTLRDVIFFPIMK
jgi:lysyl-tRNA synthetase class 2